jgi:hypothetical protein
LYSLPSREKIQVVAHVGDAELFSFIDDNIPGNPNEVTVQTSIPKVGERPDERMIQVVDWRNLALFQYG